MHALALQVTCMLSILASVRLAPRLRALSRLQDPTPVHPYDNSLSLISCTQQANQWFCTAEHQRHNLSEKAWVTFLPFEEETPNLCALLGCSDRRSRRAGREVRGWCPTGTPLAFVPLS
jgi:hypothetical protein